MKKLLLKSMLLLCALIAGSLDGWAQTPVTIWSEDFSSYSANDVPSGGTYSYLCTDGGTTTKIYNEGTAGGTAPEILVSKANGSFSATITDFKGCTGSFTLTYYTNQNGLLSISSANAESISAAVSTGTTNQYRRTITLKEGETQLNLVFTNTSSGKSPKNLRLDEIVLTGVVASGKAEAGLSYSIAKHATTFGAAFPTPSLSNPNSLTITYATSDATVADVNTTTGAITIKNKIGSATITASTEGDATHDAGSASYTIYVFEHDGSAANNAYTVAEARTFIANELYNAEEGYYLSGIVASVGSYDNTTKGITYYISDNGANSNTITVYKGKGLNGADFAKKEDMQVLDQVTLLGKFLYYNNNTPEITNSEQVSFKRKASAELLVEDDFDMYRDTEKNVEDLYVTASDGQVSFESSNETVAKVEGGKLKALAVGTATITINVAATEDYSAGSDEVVVTVKNRGAVAPEGSNAGTGYFKVTDASTLAEGVQFILVGDDADAMAGQSGNVRTVEAVTVSNGSVASIGSNVQVVTLEGSAGEWYLKVEDDKYLCAVSSDKNYIGTTATKTNEAKATITINASGEATIVFQGSNTRNNLRYNYNSGTPRFTCYGPSSTMEKPVIYRYANVNTFDITIGSTGYKTLISAVSATLPAGVTAYKAVSVGEGKIQLTSVASIKAGSAYVLKGAAGNYTLTITDTPEEPTGNILEVSDESTSNGVYVLANGSNGAGFYKWMGGSLGAGRAIVPASAVTGGAHEFLGFDFDGETTAINNLTPSLSKGEGAFYDLQGRKVAQPTKGLYIVNGKKVIVK